MMSLLRSGLLVGVAAASMVACATAPTATTATSTSTPAGHAAGGGRSGSSPPANPRGSPAPVAPGILSGTWSGRYDGPPGGTMELTWVQSGSRLTGQITHSTPAKTLQVIGLLKAGDVTFATDGPDVITYAGTVSGNSMSGTFQTAGSSRRGTWRASKAG